MKGLRVTAVSGLDYLARVTALCQAIRTAHPTHGVWEAADFQWWWRVPRPTDAIDQLFFVDSSGADMGAVIRTAWRDTTAVDVLTHAALRNSDIDVIWDEAVSVMKQLPAVESLVDENDPRSAARLVEAGLSDTGERGGSAWLEVHDLPPVSVLTAGYTLTNRAIHDAGDHHMAERIGADVEARLRQTSLYRDDLDLAVVAPDGVVVAYGIFWFDPETRTGFVEPMGTDHQHRRQGLARHVLTTGLHRLAEVGARSIRINYEVGNPAAALYSDAGFEPSMTTVMYRRR